MAYYHIIACNVLWREICHFASLSQNRFTFNFLRQGLHDTPDTLRATVQQAIADADQEKADAILLGYGLCSGGLSPLTAHQTPLVAIRAHDCITCFLGSKERYQAYFQNHPGTYWYSPGWIEGGMQPGKERYEKLRAQYVEKYGEENADYLMEMEQGWFKKYNHAAYVDLGFVDASPYQAYTRECATWLQWQYETLKGDPKLLIDWLNGLWDPNRFQKVPPGATLQASNDEAIFRT